MELQDRVQRLEDRVEINDLIVRYFLAADGDDLAGVGKSFTEAAIFSSSGIVTGEGRQGIVSFIKSSREQMGLTVHTPHYVQLIFDGPDRARGLVGAHLELVLGETAVFGAVRYVDEYHRIADEWRIHSRDMRTIHIAPWLDVGQALGSATPVRWPGAPGVNSDFPRKS
jgi:hypothetical protein